MNPIYRLLYCVTLCTFFVRSISFQPTSNILTNTLNHNRENQKFVDNLLFQKTQTNREKITALFSSRRRISRPKSKKKNLFTPTNILIGINIIMFLITRSNPSIQLRFLKNNYRIARGETYRLFTSIFLHGGFPHLMMNCYSLYQIGPQAEQLFGSRFVPLYISSGVLANIGTFATNTSPYALGASGSIFGILGAIAMHFYKNKKVLGRYSEAALSSIKTTLMINLFYGFSMSHIDNWAHLGGFLAGGSVSYLIGPNLRIIRNRIGQIKVVEDNPNFLQKLFIFKKTEPAVQSLVESRKDLPTDYSEYGDLRE